MSIRSNALKALSSPALLQRPQHRFFGGLKTINVFGRCIIVNHCLFTLGMENKI